MSNNERELPSRPLCPEVRVVQAGSNLTLAHRPSQQQLIGTVAGIILLVHLSMGFWIFVAQSGSNKAHGDPTAFDWFGYAIGLGVFISMGLVLTVFMLVGFFGGEQVSVGPYGLSYERRVVVALRRLCVSLSEIKEIRAAVATTGGDFPQDVPVVEFDTAGRAPLQFAMGIEQNEQAWLVGLLNNHLKRVRSEVIEANDRENSN